MSVNTNPSLIAQPLAESKSTSASLTRLHRFAWITAVLTLLLPVTTGAVVTTLKAGMVFSDWPSSDGYNMLAYPWLNAARDQFVEHGHRLSGSTVGLVSLLMGIQAWRLNRSRTVRAIAIAIFAAVVIQGLLGGARVLGDKQVLALVHGDFGALVFSLMAILILITSRGWNSRPRLRSIEDSRSISNIATLLLVSLVTQYILGGFLRHLRENSAFAWAWMVHPWFALVVVFITVFFVFATRGTESPHVRRCSIALIGLAIAQSLLGLATWYVRYGVPEWGIVAQQDSLPQIVICSLHKVVGMLTLMAGVLAVVVCRSVKPIRDEQQSSLSVGSSVAGAVT